MHKFRMETALKVRKRIEKVKQKELAEQLQMAQNLKDRIDESGQEVKSSNSQINEAKQQGFTIMQLQLHESFRKRIKQEVTVLHKKLKKQQEVVEVKRKDLLKHSQKRRALEILKENDLKEYKKQQEKMERAEMDEISQNSFLLKKSHPTQS